MTTVICPIPPESHEKGTLECRQPWNRPPTRPRPVLDDLAYLRTVMVNVYFVGPPDAGDREWVLVDAGMPGSADRIARRGRGAVRPRLPPGGHRPDPRPLRPRRGAGAARAALGRAGLRPPDGTALPDGPVLLPAARPVRRRWARLRPVVELPPRPDRPRRPRGAPARGWVGPRPARLAVGVHPRPHPRPRRPVPGRRPDPDRRRRGRDHAGRSRSWP